MIRPARPADGPAIGSIKVETWRHAYAGLLSAAVLDGLDADREAADWGAYTERLPSDHRLIVACRDERVVGYGRSEPCPDADTAGAGEVAGLYVHPSEQGAGAGRAMLTWLVDDLVARGLSPVVLWHFVGNAPAEAFYQSLGFTLDGARRPLPGLEIDEVRRRLRTDDSGPVGTGR